MAVGQLTDVNKALNAILDLYEGAELNALSDLACGLVANTKRVDNLLPRIGLSLLEPKADALTLPVNVKNLDVDKVADGNNLTWVIDMRPRKLRNMDQAVNPLEVNESAELNNVGDGALNDLAWLEPVKDGLTHFLALLFKHCASRENNVVA